MTVIIPYFEDFAKVVGSRTVQVSIGLGTAYASQIFRLRMCEGLVESICVRLSRALGVQTVIAQDFGLLSSLMSADGQGLLDNGAGHPAFLVVRLQTICKLDLVHGLTSPPNPRNSYFYNAGF